MILTLVEEQVIWVARFIMRELEQSRFFYKFKLEPADIVGLDSCQGLSMYDLEGICKIVNA